MAVKQYSKHTTQSKIAKASLFVRKNIAKFMFAGALGLAVLGSSPYANAKMNNYKAQQQDTSKAANQEILEEAKREIKKATGESAYEAFYALQNPAIAKLFTQNPQAFVDIAKATGESAYEAFRALQNPAIAKLFSEDPARFVKIAKENGENTPEAFWALVK
ncbi:MAG: hypothetical protein V1822_01390 [Candidatus Micrarchaeota archaeon]